MTEKYSIGIYTRIHAKGAANKVTGITTFNAKAATNVIPPQINPDMPDISAILYMMITHRTNIYIGPFPLRFS